MSGGDDRPIGIFDSGIGGMTVLREIQRLLPHENLYYIGDTARVPYGGKSVDTVLRYSREISTLLLEADCKMVVAACNTASALAVEKLSGEFSEPIIGVVEPGASAAIAATRNGCIGVIGTRATIASRAYETAIDKHSPAKLRVSALACPLLVPLIEEGWFNEPETLQIAERYLRQLLDGGIDTLVLGCTHYPLLKPCLQQVAGEHVTLVDSAYNCAAAVADLLQEKNLESGSTVTGSLRVGLTDRPDSFLEVIEQALALEIPRIEHIVTN